MSDAHAVARDQLLAFITRIERLEEEKKTIADDIKDVYGEAKGTGFDTKILREVIKIRKQDKDERAEREALLDTYMMALGMIAQPDFFDDEPEQREPVAQKSAALRRSDNGLNILTKHEDIRTAPETAEEAEPEAAAEVAGNDLREPAAAEQGQIIREGDAPRETDRLGGDASCLDTEFQMDRATEGSFETGSEAAEKGREAIPASPEGVDLSHAGAGESPATLCEYCNGSGDVHRIDGEWLGRCHCEAGKYPSDDGADHAAAANAGGDDVESSAPRAGNETQTSNTGEGTACALPTTEITLEYVPASGVKRLPFAHCFPELSKADYERLERDIAANRVQTPIVRRDDVIIDGWARYMISRQYGMSYPVQEYTGCDILLDVIEWQRAARNFTPAQEKKIAAELAKEIPHRAGDIMAAFGLVEALEAAE